MIIVGIDPGINGACAALCPADNEGPEYVVDAIDIPVIEDGAKREIDETALMKWLLMINPGRAIVENVQPMPSIPDPSGKRRSMGSASAFRFGMAIGSIRATVRCAKIPLTPVTPGQWKKYYDLRGPDKEPSRQLALEFYPEAAYLLKRKKDHQRAEAILLARYLERRMRGINRLL